MIIDKALQVSNKQVVMVTAPSADVIDFGQATPNTGMDDRTVAFPSRLPAHANAAESLEAVLPAMPMSSFCRTTRSAVSVALTDISYMPALIFSFTGGRTVNSV